MRFPQVVLDGERVVAKGEISALREVNGERLADCNVRLNTLGAAHYSKVMLPSEYRNNLPLVLKQYLK